MFRAGKMMACLQLTCALTFFPVPCTQDSLRDKSPKVNLTLAADIWALGCVIFGIFIEKHLIRDVESYQKFCTKCIPETLAETLYPVMSRRVDQYLDQAVAAVVKKTVVPAPAARAKALAVHKMLANLIGRSSSCK